MVISLNQSTPLLRCLLNNTVFVAFSLLNVFLIYKNSYQSVRTKYINNPRIWQVTEKEVYLYKNIK